LGRGEKQDAEQGFIVGIGSIYRKGIERYLFQGTIPGWLAILQRSFFGRNARKLVIADKA
jgi:hypothetical protein